jgi:hypothetical protein
MTWANDQGSGVVYPGGGWVLPEPNITLVFHNAPWDWAVLRAMGCGGMVNNPFVDTMERAYIRREPTKSLKGLAWRHLRLKMRTWEDVCTPHYHAALRVTAGVAIVAGTTVITHSPKGTLYKKPRRTLTPEARGLKKALDNVKLLAKRLGDPQMNLRYVPRAEAEAYAIEDAVATARLAMLWGLV